MNFISILNLVRAGQFRFAAFMTLIVTTSIVAEFLAGCRYEQLHLEPQKSVKEGIITKPLMKLLTIQKTFEAPFSFAVMCYAWTFAIQDGFSLICGIISLLMGIYILADGVDWVKDLDETNDQQKQERSYCGMEDETSSTSSTAISEDSKDFC